MIRLMDSSIRDGGNVNDWNFGRLAIQGIITNLVKARIDYVELGYLKNCAYDCDKTIYNTVSEAKRNLPAERGNTIFSLMTQVDKWDWNKLEPCDGSIRIIRVSFHKTRIDDGIKLIRKVKQYGYLCHCNPINIMGYEDDELFDLIKKINEVSPDVFTIVDTFGSMSIDSLRRIDSILHHNLDKDIVVSAHLHQNLGLAFAQAIEFVNYFNAKRDVIVDASLDGIGRIPGNLCIELVANYLNDEMNGRYLRDYLYDAIDDYISAIKRDNPWGYEPVYALSGFYNLHRTYPEYLMNKGKLKTKDIRCILERIVPEHRVIYDEKYIEKLYKEYMDNEIDDTDSKNILKQLLDGKNIIIIAPGASLATQKDKIIEFCRMENVVSLSINFLCDFVKNNYVLFTSTKRISQFSDDKGIERRLLSSNLSEYANNNDLLFSYYWLSTHGQDVISEDGVLMALHLLGEIKYSSITIAGFDSLFGAYGHYDKSMELVNSEFDRGLSIKRNVIKQYVGRGINLLTEKGILSLDNVIEKGYIL